MHHYLRGTGGLWREARAEERAELVEHLQQQREKVAEPVRKELGKDLVKLGVTDQR